MVKLSQAGLPIPQSFVRERFGIPEAGDGEAVLSVALPATSAAQARAVPALHETRDAHAQADQDIEAQAPDLMAGRMEIETEAAWAGIMDRIKALVDEADSLPALRDALLAAFGDLPTEKLAEAMAMGFAAADLAGRFAVAGESDGG